MYVMVYCDKDDTLENIDINNKFNTTYTIPIYFINI